MIVLLISALAVATSACDRATQPVRPPQPDWVETVYPAPGSSTAVVQAVEVDHAITRTDEDVRLVVDGVDVTTYAAYEAGLLRYESGVGPVVLSSGPHSAEVQRVRLPAQGLDYIVLDSYEWEFDVG